MKILQNSCIFFLIICSEITIAQKIIRVQSPDRNIVFSFMRSKGFPVYQVEYKGRRLIDKSTLGLVFKEDGDFAGGLIAGKPILKNGDETYELVVGKTKTVHSQYGELTVPLTRTGVTGIKQVNIVVRVFNDGVAFRYEFPAQKNWTAYTLTDEQKNKYAHGFVRIDIFFHDF